MPCFFATATRENRFLTAATIPDHPSTVFKSETIDRVVLEARTPSGSITDLAQLPGPWKPSTVPPTIKLADGPLQNDTGDQRSGPSGPKRLASEHNGTSSSDQLPQPLCFFNGAKMLAIPRLTNRCV